VYKPVLTFVLQLIPSCDGRTVSQSHSLHSAARYRPHLSEWTWHTFAPPVVWAMTPYSLVHVDCGSCVPCF